MGRTYPALDERLISFIKAQTLFFVATAPLSGGGGVNLSPKGYDSLMIEDEKTVLWADLGGSGAETIAHLKENGRITLMFCAFEGRADIVRLYGRGEVVQMGDDGFGPLLETFPNFDRARAIIRLHISRISDSCGWGVPFMEFKGERDQLRRWVEKDPVEAWAARRFEKNEKSIDGLPALTRPEA